MQSKSAIMTIRPVGGDTETPSPEVNIDPNETGLPGISTLREIVGASMTIGLIIAVLALIISGAVWAIGSQSSNPHLATRAKTGVIIACVAAILTGSAVTLINFFWDTGKAVS